MLALTLASYLIALWGHQQGPGEVGVEQTVELPWRLYRLHVEAVASKDVDGISLLMVDGWVTI